MEIIHQHVMKRNQMPFLDFSTITQANPESSVGLMSMGGKGPEVLVTLTTDHGKILDGLHRTKTKIRGSSHLATGIQIAGWISNDLPILNGDGATGGVGMGGAETSGDAGAFEFGIDPSVDPELALALRMSMEDEKARVEKNEKDRLEKEAAEQSALGEIKEEDEASAPLLNKDGEASGSGDKKDDDKMDTA
ncbi:uncharacterized protein EAF02_011821 [Botrytis sinoallii]|uniref:uncharacterized protein n=1 Tax=Botrytis sinoallii TaxID=1463999 RepID=UPI0018FF9027|nr:uncharacterized protein EAF02_011821 [Botrytis sinoallii]KAF7853831.1 hypothetical protein EAF02_011821 [Botrytis sinoallii]